MAKKQKQDLSDLTTNPGGAPVKEIDFALLDKLCGLHCTGEEVAAFFGIDYDTLNARIKEKFNIGYSEYFQIKKGIGHVSLRRKMMERALEGDNTMLIWLSKQYLGMKDKAEIDEAHEVRIKVTIENTDD